jgi:hypothetical protein
MVNTQLSDVMMVIPSGRSSMVSRAVTNMVSHSFCEAIKVYPGNPRLQQMLEKLRPMYHEEVLNIMKTVARLSITGFDDNILREAIEQMKAAAIKKYYPRVKETFPRYRWLQEFLQDAYVTGLELYMEIFEGEKIRGKRT